MSMNGKERGCIWGWEGEIRERQAGSEEVTDYKIAKNDSWEAITTIFFLLSSGKLVKWT